jgi:hypothetical protein
MSFCDVSSAINIDRWIWAFPMVGRERAVYLQMGAEDAGPCPRAPCFAPVTYSVRLPNTLHDSNFKSIAYALQRSQARLTRERSSSRVLFVGLLLSGGSAARRLRDSDDLGESSCIVSDVMFNVAVRKGQAVRAWEGGRRGIEVRSDDFWIEENPGTCFPIYIRGRVRGRR